jgi:hypothetical protein
MDFEVVLYDSAKSASIASSHWDLICCSIGYKLHTPTVFSIDIASVRAWKGRSVASNISITHMDSQLGDILAYFRSANKKIIDFNT